MKKLLIGIILSIVLSVLFIIGVVIPAPALLIMAFCAWTPVAWFTGFAFGRAGLRLAVSLDHNTSTPSHAPTPRPVRRSTPEFR